MVRAILGHEEKRLQQSVPFRNRVTNELEDFAGIPVDAWWATDYHISWLAGALAVLVKGDPIVYDGTANQPLPPWSNPSVLNTEIFQVPPSCGTRFFKHLLKGLQYVPRVIITDKLRSYGVAQRDLLPNVEHRQSRYLNNRAENSHRPTRRRERQMQRLKSSGQAQNFLSAHAFIHGHSHPRRHLMAATNYRAIRSDAFSVWKQETCSRRTA